MLLRKHGRGREHGEGINICIGERYIRMLDICKKHPYTEETCTRRGSKSEWDISIQREHVYFESFPSQAKLLDNLFSAWARLN